MDDKQKAIVAAVSVGLAGALVMGTGNSYPTTLTSMSGAVMIDSSKEVVAVDLFLDALPGKIDTSNSVFGVVLEKTQFATGVVLRIGDADTTMPPLQKAKGADNTFRFTGKQGLIMQSECDTCTITGKAKVYYGDNSSDDITIDTK